MPTRSAPTDATLGAALRTPAFWVFALASAVYGLVASGIALFNESILAERGFAPDVYHRSLVVTAMTALVGNFAGGAFADGFAAPAARRGHAAADRRPARACRSSAPRAHVMAYAVVMGLAGGFVMVVFFSFWGRAYGRAHLGRIQGAAQALTVLASAIGPLLLAGASTRPAPTPARSMRSRGRWLSWSLPRSSSVFRRPTGSVASPQSC